MTTDHAASVQGVALRVCKLDATGAPLVGASNAFVTNAFMSIGWTPEYVQGDEIQDIAADGSICTYYQVPSVLKRVTFNLAICAPDPELQEILAGGTLLEDGSNNVIGYAPPGPGEIPTPNGVSIEVWSKAIVGGKPASVNPYWRWLFPYTQMVFDGERVLENGAMANTFTGYGLGNAAWGDGPQNDWDQASDKAFQYVRAASFPTGINGYQAVIADS